MNKNNLKFTHLISSDEGVELETQTLYNYVDYEVRGSWWVQWLGWHWLQEISAAYFARKTKRKFKRFLESKAYFNIHNKVKGTTGIATRAIQLNDQKGWTFDIHIPVNRKVRLSFDNCNYAEISMSSSGDIKIHQLTGKNPRIYNFCSNTTPGMQVTQKHELSLYDKELLYWYFEGYIRNAYQSTNPYIKPEYNAVWNLGIQDAKSGICESMPGIINPKTLERIYEAVKQQTEINKW
jgi:hypothetical protein